MKSGILHFIIFYFCFNFAITIKRSKRLKKDKIQTDDYTVIKIIRRPETYYTQGLYFDDNDKSLVESGGLYGESVVVRMEFPSLKVIKKIDLDRKFFGEGIAKCANFVYQLTWRERQILKYDSELKFIGYIDFPEQIKEGWGLAESNNPNELIATDGSHRIFFLDCNNDLKVLKTIDVIMDGKQIPLLNSLTFANDFIWANKYTDNRIFKINPENGKVVKTFDMTQLVDNEIKKNTLTNDKLIEGYVLNGITYCKKNKFFLLTGKRWGHYYEVEFK